GLFRKLDIDGVSRLEELDGADSDGEVEDTRVSAPRVRRTEESAAVPGDTAAHRLYEQSVDKDRHTEVGGPPTGPVAKADAGIARAQATSSRGKLLAIIAGLVVLLALGGGIWAFTRDRDPAPKIVTPSTADAAVIVEDERGTLTVAPLIEGATGYLEVVGERTRQEIGPLSHGKPFNAKVPANKQLHLHLELPGHLPYDDASIEVPPKQNLLLKPSFSTAPAQLAITTDPAGVQVTLAGRLLGETPKTFENLTPGKDLALQLARPGYQSVTRKITLEAGKTLTLAETLRENQRFGKVQVVVANMWADVYWNGQMLGRNATRTGLQTFRIAVGRQKLLLVNPVAKKQKTISVVIQENRVTSVSETL
ncbi:MAG TPA: PEGA domain-containing protein, partial [Kofleriaceae bacterium]|nr:PEGA domain-containing protein [Kofleriaceae bacterium]